MMKYARIFNPGCKFILNDLSLRGAYPLPSFKFRLDTRTMNTERDVRIVEIIGVNKKLFRIKYPIGLFSQGLIFSRYTD